MSALEISAGYDTGEWVGRLIAPIAPVLYASIVDAHAACLDCSRLIMDKYGPVVSDSDINALRNRLGWHILGKQLHSDPAVHFIGLDEPDGQRLLCYQGQVSLRVKKYNKDLIVSNYPTAQNREYYQQHLFDHFPRGLLRLDLCYRIDRTGLSVAEVNVVRWLSDPRKSNACYLVRLGSEGVVSMAKDWLPLELSEKLASSQ